MLKMRLLSYHFRVHLFSEDTPDQKLLPDGGVTDSARMAESADRAAAQIAGLEDKLERESSEKRELQNQVR